MFTSIILQQPYYGPHFIDEKTEKPGLTNLPNFLDYKKVISIIQI